MRFYRVLLRLYPASFRNEYGEEMCAVFAQRRSLWLVALLEVLVNAAAVHGDILRQDLVYAARTLRRTPGFTLVAILVAALGIGATTAVFSVVDFVFLRPMPFADPGRLVALWENVPGYPRMELSPANYQDWKQLNSVFAGMGAMFANSANLVGQGEPERVNTERITADLLPVLGVQPFLGRLFTGADDNRGAPGTVMLSYRLWQAVFGGDAGVLGRKVILDNAPYTVIGILPQNFRFPDHEEEADLCVPMQFPADAFADRNDNFLQVIGRLRAGVSVEQARAAMSVIASQLERQFPKENKQTGATVDLLRDEIPQQSRMLLAALSGAALCLLLIACTNLANLLLARALLRRRELAVRTAMGAGRERLVRQLITESMLLALVGGLLGVLAAYAAAPLLTKLTPWALPMAGQPAIDIRVLSFAGLLTVLTGIAFGVVPALGACRGGDANALREGARAGGGRKARLRSALVISEVTLSMILLISAGLLLRALWKIQGIDPGFRTEGVLTLRTALPIPKYQSTARRAAFYQHVIAEVEALPGVSKAAYISFLPMAMAGGIWPVDIDGKTVERSEAHTASLRFVSPDFFDALQIPLLEGRKLSELDTIKQPQVAVVSESLVERYWPGQNPLGRRFQFAFAERTVVGVVRDIKVRGLERKSEPQVYLPYQQVPDQALIAYTPKDLVVRASGNPSQLLPAIRHIVHEADPEQPVSNVRMLSEIVAENTGMRAMQARVLTGFAGLALLLAGIGIHGVLSFAVSTRSREIGVRMALGAQRRDILGMVLRQGILLALAGILPGMVLAYAAGRMVQSVLAGVPPADATTFGAVGLLSLLMVLAGSLAPAVRALRVDPITAIRAE